MAAREGVTLGSDTLDRALEKAAGLPFETKSSFQRDIEAGGQNEIDPFGVVPETQRHDIAKAVYLRLGFVRITSRFVLKV
ncbi:MAG: hypothetical protein Q7V14_05305 [Coriobacteriia bacterium]|nr:hypothetical protein [Coriobacteriia bacterium]